MDVLEADVRGAIATTLATGEAITTAFIDADDFESAMPELDSIDRTPSEPGAAHILGNCGVDIDGSAPNMLNHTQTGQHVRQIPPMNEEATA